MNVLKRLIEENNINELKSYALFNNIKLNRVHGHCRTGSRNTESSVSSTASSSSLDANIHKDSIFDVLLYAIEQKCSLDIIEYIIGDYGNNINYEISHTQIPIYKAIELENYTVSDLLLKKNANINYVNGNGINILIHLFYSGVLNIPMLRYIMNHGININFEDSNGKKFLEYTIYNKNESFLKPIIEHYVFDVHFILQMITWSKRQVPLPTRQLKRILQKEKDKLFVTKDMYISAINNGSLVTIQKLWQIHNPLEMQKLGIDNDYELLICAAKNNNIEIVKFLLERGIDVNEREKQE